MVKIILGIILLGIYVTARYLGVPADTLLAFYAPYIIIFKQNEQVYFESL